MQPQTILTSYLLVGILFISSTSGQFSFSDFKLPSISIPKNIGNLFGQRQPQIQQPAQVQEVEEQEPLSTPPPTPVYQIVTPSHHRQYQSQQQPELYRAPQHESDFSQSLQQSQRQQPQQYTSPIEDELEEELSQIQQSSYLQQSQQEPELIRIPPTEEPLSQIQQSSQLHQQPQQRPQRHASRGNSGENSSEESDENRQKPQQQQHVPRIAKPPRQDQSSQYQPRIEIPPRRHHNSQYQPRIEIPPRHEQSSQQQPRIEIPPRFEQSTQQQRLPYQEPQIELLPNLIEEEQPSEIQQLALSQKPAVVTEPTPELQQAQVQQKPQVQEPLRATQPPQEFVEVVTKAPLQQLQQKPAQIRQEPVPEQKPAQVQAPPQCCTSTDVEQKLEAILSKLESLTQKIDHLSEDLSKTQEGLEVQSGTIQKILSNSEQCNQQKSEPNLAEFARATPTRPSKEVERPTVRVLQVTSAPELLAYTKG